MPTEITGRGSQYTIEQKQEAAVIYAECGLGSKTSQLTGIPETTVSLWKKTEWWDEIVADIRSANKDQHIAQFERLQTLALDQCEVALPKATAQQAATVAAIMQDKSRTLQALPNQHTGESDGIRALTERFNEMAAQHRRIESTVVATQTPSEDDQDIP